MVDACAGHFMTPASSGKRVGLAPMEFEITKRGFAKDLQYFSDESRKNSRIPSPVEKVRLNPGTVISDG